MALWFSKEDDGSGKTTGYVESVLNEAQGEKPVDFDEFVMEVCYLLQVFVQETKDIECRFQAKSVDFGELEIYFLVQTQIIIVSQSANL